MDVFLALLILNFKTALAMRWAFLIRMFFTLINHGIVLVAWLFFYKAIPVVYGWNMWHLMMAYGLSWFAWGFVSFFTHGYKTLPRTIEFGELDHFLLQPRPLLLVLAANNGEIFGAPDMVLASVLITCAALKLHALWGLVIFAVTCAVVTFGAFTLLVGSLAFWLTDMHDFLYDLQYNTYVFGTRPASAFSGWIKLLMFSILPMGFISYLPVQVVRLDDPLLIGAQILGTGGVIFAAILMFRMGLKNYESGNRFGVRT